jgi:hypothetical protein
VGNDPHLASLLLLAVCVMESRQPPWLSLTGTAPSGGAFKRANNLCQPYNLPIGGIIVLPNGEPITLTTPATFRPACIGAQQPNIIAGNGGAGFTDLAEVAGGAGVNIDSPSELGPAFSDFRDPFYSSTFPQCYALAATTVIAYTLVIMLFITPRSFLDGGVVVLGRSGFTNGGAGGINIGGRPWLQKVAALTVAISLTIATADTFRVAEDQYSWGIQNAPLLQQEVLGGTQLKVIRIISDTFLWLAQAQTLIRLFPRQREKIIIKWTAFSLITLDVIFDSLNSFLYSTSGRTFTDAIPALSYLFQLCLGVLYAAWVIYYSLMKKRYAFYHRQMRNMCLVAALSLIALLVPVVFFVLDVSKPDVAGWGDYVRWVGAAAASVIVWEWVERIEALEREEQKDGILGREVFDGDEMLDANPSEFTWPRRRKGHKNKEEGGDDDDEESSPGTRDGAPAGTARPSWPTMSSITSRYRSRSRSGRKDRESSDDTVGTRLTERSRFLQPPLWPARPQPAVTPVSRTDTTSADSTVYQVRYHPLTETTSHTTDYPAGQPPLSRTASTASSHRDGAADASSTQDLAFAGNSSANRWRTLAQAMPFRRDFRETRSLGTAESMGQGTQQEEPSRWDIKSRLEEFAVSQAERLRERVRPSVNTDSLPVNIIPAPSRNGAALARVLEEDECQQRSGGRRAERRLRRSSLESPRSRSGSRGRSKPDRPTGEMPPGLAVADLQPPDRAGNSP